MNFEMGKIKTSGQAVPKLKRTFIIMSGGFFNGLEVEYRIQLGNNLFYFLWLKSAVLHGPDNVATAGVITPWVCCHSLNFLKCSFHWKTPSWKTGEPRRKIWPVTRQWSRVAPYNIMFPTDCPDGCRLVHPIVSQLSPFLWRGVLITCDGSRLAGPLQRSDCD